MSIWDRMEEVVVYMITTILGAVVGGIGWLIRRVVTNQRQIALLEQDLRARDRARTEDRERMTKIEDGVERIEGILMQGKGGGQ